MARRLWIEDAGLCVLAAVVDATTDFSWIAGYNSEAWDILDFKCQSTCIVDGQSCKDSYWTHHV